MGFGWLVWLVCLLGLINGLVPWLVGWLFLGLLFA